MTPQEAHGILAMASAAALLNEADRLRVFEANRVLQADLLPERGSASWLPSKVAKSGLAGAT